MISKRVTSFFRRITVCLTISLVSFLFVLSCQKDEGLKSKDPNALTKSQAKEYFEQTASTLKFLTAGTTPAGTKNADYSLTENMIIDWDEALEGETVDSYIVEVPIRMVSPVTALLYDGIGHYNKNIRQVQMNTSLLIEKHKADGCLHHSVVTTVGSYSTTANSKYGFLCDKSSFSGYQIFSSEEGIIGNSLFWNNGSFTSHDLLKESQVVKVDSLGHDLKFRGISIVFSKGAFTKGGGGVSSGEDNDCPICGNTLVFCGTENGWAVYYCLTCDNFVYSFIDTTTTYCIVCGYETSQCKCCKKCHSYPCICCIVCHEYPCICNPNPDPDPDPDPDPEPEPDPNPSVCALCGRVSCDGTCQIIAPYSNYFYLITVSVDSNTPYGMVTKTPTGNYIGANVTVYLTANPNPGYSFVGWKIDGSFVSYQNPYSFSATSNNNIYAVFSNN